jgi:arylamine N-acetyltransferase
VSLIVKGLVFHLKHLRRGTYCFELTTNFKDVKISARKYN